MRLTLALLAATASLAAFPAFADDCTDEIKAIMQSSMSSGPLHMESTITGTGVSMKMAGDMVPPSAMHMTVDTNGQAVEMIVLDGRAWMNMAGTWAELPADQAGEITKNFDLADMSKLEAITDAKCNGTVTVDGTDYLSYEYLLSADGADTVNAVLVDPETELPTKMSTKVTAGGTESTVDVVYTYDDSIVIEAPAS